MIGSITTPENPMRQAGDASSGTRLLVAPRGSTSDPSVVRYPMNHDVTVEADTSLSEKGRAASSSLTQDVQAAVRRPPKRPSLRRVGRRLPARTFTPPARPRKFKIPPSSPAQISADHDAASPRAPPSKPMSTPHHSEPPLVNRLQNESASQNDGEDARPTMREIFEGEESAGDEEDDVDDSECDDQEYEDVSEGREASALHIQSRLLPSYGPTSQMHPRAAWSEAHQSHTLLPKTNGRPQVPAHRVLQGHQNGSPLVKRSVPSQPKFPHPHNPPLPEPLHLRPASFTTSRASSQRTLEGPQRTTWPGTPASSSVAFSPTNRAITHPSLGGSSVNVAGPSTEWDERSEAGGSKRRSFYSQKSNSSVARSIYLEQQVARREEDAARREEEARLKEEDSRGLEMAARKAFAWVQSLEERAGKIHDAAMQAETKAQRRDAEIWERQAEMLRQQAETAKREVAVTKREIEVERAEQEARRKAREARRKEAELLVKEEDVQRKEQEALRVEEDARRMKLEIRWREEQLLKREDGRRATEGGLGAKDVVVSAWSKLKGRIQVGRDSQANKQNTLRILQDKDKFDDNGIGVGSKSSTSANTDQEMSTRPIVQFPRHVKVERRRTRSTTRSGSMTNSMPEVEREVSEQDELRSVSHVWTSECGTSAEASAEYTVRSVNSYKERLHRSQAGYFRHRYASLR